MAPGNAKSALPTRRSVDVAIAVFVSAAVATAVVLGLWPPGWVYWTRLSALVGEVPTQVAVGAVALGLGAWFARTSGFGMWDVVVGAAFGFGVATTGIELILAPDSPASLALYGGIVTAFVGGAVAWTALRRYRAVD